jgi:hypothetical protein
MLLYVKIDGKYTTIIDSKKIKKFLDEIFNLFDDEHVEVNITVNSTDMDKSDILNYPKR